MNENKTNEKMQWMKPEVIVINVEEYEELILANANSFNCGWDVICANAL